MASSVIGLKLNTCENGWVEGRIGSQSQRSGDQVRSQTEEIRLYPTNKGGAVDLKQRSGRIRVAFQKDL